MRRPWVRDWQRAVSLSVGNQAVTGAQHCSYLSYRSTACLLLLWLIPELTCRDGCAHRRLVVQGQG